MFRAEQNEDDARAQRGEDQVHGDAPERPQPPSLFEVRLQAWARQKAALIVSMRIFIDADACPVKDETYKVAARYGLVTTVVSNSFIAIPPSKLIERMIVDAGPDVADDWIAERTEPGDIVVTNDIPLADRVLKAGGAAIAPNGRLFTPDSIGSALAQRSIMEHIRSTGEITGGPRPFAPADRSRFLQALDEAVNQEKRKRR
jgi:uncharacterized protein YaiI (UPF0178 family)